MFNWVKINKQNICHFCGQEMGEDGKVFQTKDMETMHNDPYMNGGLTCDIVDESAVQNYYADCPHCKKWNEYTRQPLFIFVNNIHYNKETINN